MFGEMVEYLWPVTWAPSEIPQKVKMGKEAWETLREQALVPTGLRGIDRLLGIPVFIDETYPPDVWRLFNGNGEVLKSGTSRFILSRADLYAQMEEMEAAMGGEEYNCSGWDGPCGGCARCGRAQVSYYFDQMRREADRYHSAGFEWAPKAIASFRVWAERHDSYSCWTAKERPEGTFPWEKL